MDLSPTTPTISSLPFTPGPELPHHFVHIISSLLSPAECASIIAAHANLIPSNVTPGTVRTREVFEDAELAERLWERVKNFYVDMDGEARGVGWFIDDDGELWVISGLNECFRLCLYEKGGKFSPHTDGCRLASVDSQAFMTLNMYLNTVPLSSHGATRFLSSSSPMDPEKQTVLASSQPVLGSAAIFRDDLWHDGEELLAGQKWLLRTDIMFKRDRPFDWTTFCTERGWVGDMNDEKREAKARKALSLAEGLEDTESGGEAIGWYKIAFKEWPALERGC